MHNTAAIYHCHDLINLHLKNGKLGDWFSVGYVGGRTSGLEDRTDVLIAEDLRSSSRNI